MDRLSEIEVLLSTYINKDIITRVLRKSPISALEIADNIITILKKQEIHIIHKFLSDLDNMPHHKRESDNASYKMLDWEHVLEMSSYGINFGSHTKSHEILTSLNNEQARDEILNSKIDIESRLDKEIYEFCYPNGDADGRIASIVKNSSYNFAFTTVPGSITYNDDPFMLKRIGMHEDMSNSTGLFACRLLGVKGF